MNQPRKIVTRRTNPKMTSGLIGWHFLLVLFLMPVFLTACETTPKRTEGRSAITRRNIGEANMMQGNYSVALKELLEAEKIDPKDPVTQNYLGITFKNKNMPDKAIEHFNRALNLKSDYSVARNNLGTVYLDKKEWDIAIGYFSSVLDDILYTTPHYPLSNIGWAYFSKGDFASAKSYYMKALEVQPNFVIALNGLGQTYTALSDYGQAVFIYEKIIRKAPTVPDFQLKLAQAHELNGDLQKAVHYYSRFLQMAPHNPKEAEIREKISILSNQ
jgi:type IV pilus assembly protein PilF